ncbi:DUF6115 domain-containing protein [Paenibacillus arenilitoris]|uniref:Uncharacterized protein n=1 Tax=Paenibacillus arenilitoris TaxID=2772299 RepID=A0A927H764_9BACL|nr:hypothetical protein [Paenibacillus arenilitoris]MBD2870710.1 hypothetical protein [Paenibacillus arenilitoris]
MQPYLQYILLLGAVVIVGALAMPRKKNESIPEQTVQNMETALEQFMENMEKDNAELASLVAKSQQEAKLEAQRKELRIAELERKCEQLAEQLRHSSDTSAGAARQTAHAEPKPGAAVADSVREVPVPAGTPEAAPQSDSIQTRYSDLFRLYGQGKSIEAISKKLGMNKGEVQLIIQLAKQEDAAHA